jgi:amino acid permease
MRRISPISWLLLLIAVVFIAVGVIYFAFTVPKLPTFMPGYVKHVHHARHYTKRGIAAFIVAGVCLVGVFYKDFRSA